MLTTLTYENFNEYIHFFSANDPKDWIVSFGLLLSDPQIKRTVKEIIIHENYRHPAHDNDIAVVRLSSPVLYASNIRRACLPEANYRFPPNTKVVVTGWGTLKSDGEFLTFLCPMTSILGAVKYRKLQLILNIFSHGSF